MQSLLHHGEDLTEDAKSDTDIDMLPHGWWIIPGAIFGFVVWAAILWGVWNVISRIGALLSGAG